MNEGTHIYSVSKMGAILEEAEQERRVRENLKKHGPIDSQMKLARVISDIPNIEFKQLNKSFLAALYVPDASLEEFKKRIHDFGFQSDSQYPGYIPEHQGFYNEEAGGEPGLTMFRISLFPEKK